MPRKPIVARGRAETMTTGGLIVIDRHERTRRHWPHAADSPVVEGLFTHVLTAARRADLAEGLRFIVIEIAECSIERFTTSMTGVKQRIQNALLRAAQLWQPGECRFTDPIRIVDAHPEVGTCAVRLAVLDGKTDLDQALQGRMEQGKTREREARHERIRALLERPPSRDFEKEHAAAEELTHLVRLELIDRLEKPFNQAMRAKPHESYEDKKELCKWANDRLRQCSLAVRCPVTGLPAFLWGGQNRASSDGILRLQVTDPEGRQVRTKSFSDPARVDLELTEILPRRTFASRQRRHSTDTPQR